MEILVAIDDDPAKTWQRIEATRQAFESYYGDDRPAGLIYPVSRIPNLDSIIEPQPRVVSGNVEIHRSGQFENGFSTWAGFSHHGVREVQVSAVSGTDASTQLGLLDARIKEAGGTGGIQQEAHASGISTRAIFAE